MPTYPYTYVICMTRVYRVEGYVHPYYYLYLVVQVQQDVLLRAPPHAVALWEALSMYPASCQRMMVGRATIGHSTAQCLAMSSGPPSHCTYPPSPRHAYDVGEVRWVRGLATCSV